MFYKAFYRSWSITCYFQAKNLFFVCTDMYFLQLFLINLFILLLFLLFLEIGLYDLSNFSAK